MGQSISKIGGNTLADIKIREQVKKLDRKVDSFDSQIKEKANESEVFKKEIGININDFDESTRQTFLNAQGIDVNYVLGDKNVKLSNLNDTLKNSLFEYSNVNAKYFLGTISNTDGTKQDSSVRIRTNFLLLNANSVISLNDKSTYKYSVCYYDINENFITTTYNQLGTLITNDTIITEQCLVKIIIAKQDNSEFTSIDNNYLTIKKCDISLTDKLYNSINSTDKKIERYTDINLNVVEFEQGGLSSTDGSYTDRSNRCRSKDFIPVDENTIIYSNKERDFTCVLYSQPNDSSFIKSLHPETGFVNKQTFDNKYYVKIVARYSLLIGSEYIEQDITPETINNNVFVKNKLGNIGQRIDDLKNIHEGTEFVFEEGGFTNNSSYNDNTTNRIRTKDFMYAFKGQTIYCSSSYEFSLMLYDEPADYSLTKNTYNDIGFVTSYTFDKTCYFKLNVKKSNNSDISSDEFENIASQFFLKSANETSSSSFNDIEYPSYTVINRPNYPNHDSTFVGDNIWVFNRNLGPDDADAGIFKVYDSNFNETHSGNTSFWFNKKGGGTANVEMKSVDYNNNNNVLMVGNGSARYVPGDSFIYLFYDIQSWLTKGETITFDNCGEYKELDVSELGDKVYGFWGAETPENDQIFVNCDLFKNIYLIQLGKGTNNLGKGVFVSESSKDKYNGSYRILNHWQQKNLETGEDGQHGGQFYNGKLYLINNNKNTNEIYRCVLKNNGELKFDILQLAHFNNDGSMKYGYCDGLCIKDGYAYASPLNMDGSYNYDTSKKVVLKIKID